MTQYRTKLRALATRLFEGPMSRLEQVCMGKLLDRYAEPIGDLEECAAFSFAELPELCAPDVAADVAHRLRTANAEAVKTLRRMMNATPHEMTMLIEDLRGLTVTVAWGVDQLHPICADAVEEPRKILPVSLVRAGFGLL